MIKVFRRVPTEDKTTPSTITSILIVVVGILLLVTMTSIYKARIADKYASSMEDTYKSKSIELNSKLNDVNNNLAQLNDKYYEEKLMKIFSREQLMTMAKDAWIYSLKVNDHEFKEDNISTTERNINIVLTESKNPLKPFPENILKFGAVNETDKSDSFIDHMIIKTTANYEKSIKSDRNSTTIIYSFKNVQAGTIISLDLSQPLKERLKLNDNLLEVISK